MTNAYFSKSIYVDRKSAKKFSIQFLWSAEYWLLSNSVDRVKNLGPFPPNRFSNLTTALGWQIAFICTQVQWEGRAKVGITNLETYNFMEFRYFHKKSMIQIETEIKVIFFFKLWFSKISIRLLERNNNLKVSKSRKLIVVSSILPKNERNSLSWATSVLRIVSLVRFLEELKKS